MPTAKQLLVTQLTQSFEGRKDMPLMGVLADISDEQAGWQSTATTPSIDQLVRHIAWSASVYCRDGFGTPMVAEDPGVSAEGDTEGIPWEFPCGSGFGRTSHPGIAGAIDLLRRSQATMLGCLEALPDEALDRPIPNRHGRTAAHFFWIMIMHNLYHAGQIRTRRTMHSPRG